MRPSAKRPTKGKAVTGLLLLVLVSQSASVPLLLGSTKHTQWGTDEETLGIPCCEHVETAFHVVNTLEVEYRCWGGRGGVRVSSKGTAPNSPAPTFLIKAYVVPKPTWAP